jgi:cytochrome P450
MLLVRACINETLRIFPPVSVNERCSIDAGVFHPKDGSPERMYLPAKVPIVYYPILIQRRKDLWGEDAEEFKPERWLDEKGQGTSDPCRFIPFHAGPRLCEFYFHKPSLLCLLKPNRSRPAIRSEPDWLRYGSIAADV